MFSVRKIVLGLVLGGVVGCAESDIGSGYPPIDVNHSLSNGNAPPQIPSIYEGLALRGAQSSRLISTESGIVLRVQKKDFNITPGPDRLLVRVLTSSGDEVFSHEIPDDGIETSTGLAGPAFFWSELIPLPGPGLYTVDFKPLPEGSDFVFDVGTDASKIVFASHLLLNDVRRKCTLYFLAKTPAATLTTKTWHNGSWQTLTVRDDTGLRMGEIPIFEWNAPTTKVIPVSAAKNATVWSITVPKQDLQIDSTDIPYFAASRQKLFDPTLYDRLLGPSKLRVSLAPAVSKDISLQITNPLNRHETFRVTIDSSSLRFATATLQTPSNPRVTLAPQQSAQITVRVRTPSPSTVLSQDDYFKVVTTSVSDETLFSTSKITLYGEYTHPSLYWNSSEIAGARARITRGLSWAVTARNSIRDTANLWLTRDIAPPQQVGEPSTWFVCPDHGVPLDYRWNYPNRHRCPIDGIEYVGSRIDGSWRSKRHQELSQIAKNLGVAYLLTQDSTFARRAREILMRYVALYPQFPLHDKDGGTSITAGRAHGQSLEEALWLVDLLTAYDSIYSDASLSIQDKIAIENELIVPIVEVIQRNMNTAYGASNWQAWHNAAVGSAGYLLRAQDLIDQSENGPYGFHYHLAHSRRPDGMWYEGSTDYHTFALRALLRLAEAAWHSGKNLYSRDLTSMLDVPLKLSYPNFIVPWLNDGRGGSPIGQVWAYELSALRLTEPRFHSMLNSLYSSTGTVRATIEALLYGPDTLSGTYTPPGSVNLSDSGLGVLRSGDMYALLDYGPHGKSHGHADKLNFVLFSRGEELISDMGVNPYGDPRSKQWFPKTMAHNTVALGKKNQLAGSENVRPFDYYGSPTPGLQVVQATVGEDVFGSGASMTRTLIMIGDQLLVVWDSVTGSTALPKTYDWTLHAKNGLPQTLGLTFAPNSAIATEWLNSTEGYQYFLPGIVSATTSAPFKTSFVDSARPARGMDLYVVSPDATSSKVIFGETPSNPPTTNHSTLVLRKEGMTRATYAAVLRPANSIISLVSVSRVNTKTIALNLGTATLQLTVDQARKIYTLR